jgi:hypothetical protein
MAFRKYVLFILFSTPLFAWAQFLSVTPGSYDSCFLKMDEESQFKKENIEFMIKQNGNSKSQFFSFCIKNKKRIDEVMSYKVYTDNYINNIIAKEEIDPILEKNTRLGTNPNWKYMYKVISSKYGRFCANRNLVNAQIRWYDYRKDTLNLIKYNVKKIENCGIDTIGFGKPTLNNMIYYMIFRHSNELNVLDKAVQWMDILVKAEPSNYAFIDTYANLLYKIGRKKDAIKWEQKAMILAPHDEEIKGAWDKMLKGEPTWPVHN